MSDKLVIIFTHDLFGQPCRASVFARYLIYNQVNIQRAVIVSS